MSQPSIEQQLGKLNELTAAELDALETAIQAEYDKADAADDLDAMDAMVTALENVYTRRDEIVASTTDSDSDAKTETEDADKAAEVEVKADDAAVEVEPETEVQAEAAPEEEVKAEAVTEPEAATEVEAPAETAPEVEASAETAKEEAPEVVAEATDEVAAEAPAQDPVETTDSVDAPVEAEVPAEAAPEATVTELPVETAAETTVEAATTTVEETAPMAASADFQAPEDAQPVVASAATSVRVGNEIQGFNAGTDFKSAHEVASAFVQKLNAIKRSGGGDGEQLPVASIVASFPEDRMLAPGDIEGNARKIEEVTGETAIVAAGGYCAPLQVKYDIFGLGTAARPVRDGLPAFGTTRGGIRYVTPPKLGDYTGAVGLWSAGADVIGGTTQLITTADLTSNVVTITTSAPHGYAVGQTVTIAGLGSPFDGSYVIASVPTTTTFTYAKTAANVASASVNGTSNLIKPCLHVNCAAELTASADAVTLCLTFGNLMTRAYPELVSRHNALALVQHARFAEQNLLTQIGAQSTAVTSAFALGTARDFLLAIGKAAAAYRNRHRMNRTTPLRVIAPEWVLDAMREDLARQLPGDQMIAVPDAIISGYLAARNVNITWHMDDTFAAQTAGAIVDFPATIKWWIFAEGTFLFLDGGTLDIGVIRDSALVGVNDYKTFVETFEGIAKVGVESIQVTTTTHVAGGTVGTIAVA